MQAVKVTVLKTPLSFTRKKVGPDSDVGGILLQATGSVKVKKKKRRMHMSYIRVDKYIACYRLLLVKSNFTN